MTICDEAADPPARLWEHLGDSNRAGLGGSASRTVALMTARLDLERIGVLHELRPGGPSFFAQCLNSFSRRAPADIESIQSAAHTLDHQRLLSAAHALKGSAQDLGAVKVGHLCQTLEEAAERHDTSALDGLIDALTHEIERTLLALNDQLMSLGH
jgi:HPt (histidine-containing phosphotransfer) domain-containing protein